MAIIRRATTEDGPAVAAIYRPYCDNSAVSFETGAPSAEDMSKRISSIGAERPWLVLEDDRAVLGYAYAAPHHERGAYRWAVSTAIYVSNAHHRRGVGRALYATLFELLRHLGYFTATAGITLPNAGSVGLHEAFGFTLVGVYRHIGFKLGRWHDVAWYQADLQPLVADPPPPRPVSTLVGGPQWSAAIARGVDRYESRK
jgi:L-amino acid N-acyltransferase YncA